MSTTPTRDLNLRLAELLGLTPDVLRHATGFTLHVEHDAVPRLEVRRIIVDGQQLLCTTQRFKVTPICEDTAPPPPATLDLDALAAAARERVAAHIQARADVHLYALDRAFKRAWARLWVVDQKAQA